MGIYLNAVAQLPRRGFLRRPTPRDDILRSIAAQLPDCIDHALLRKLLRTETDEHSLAAFIHPAGGPLVFTWKPAGALEVEVKTSGAGPGYHAFARDLLEQLASKTGLRWTWQEDDLPKEAAAGDVGVLQAAFLDLFGATARWIVDEPSAGGGCIALDCALSDPLPTDPVFSVSPTGVWQRSWWERAAAATRAELAELAREYYAWWDVGYDGRFYRGLAQTLLLWEVPWRAVVDDSERIPTAVAREALAQAEQMGLCLPEFRGVLPELDEILADTDDLIRPPAKDGAGFRHRDMTYRFAKGWSIRAPGYFFRELKFDEACLSIPGRCIWLTIMPIPAGLAPALRAKCDESDSGEGTEFISHSDRTQSPRATFSRDVTEEGARWLLRARVPARESLAVLSIYVDDVADRDWAICTFRSLQHPTFTEGSAQTSAG